MLSVQGQTTGQIAQVLQVDRTRVHAWIGAWNEHDALGLLEGHRSGRPAELSAAQREHLADILDSGSVAYGLNTGVWTSPLIAQIIEDEFDVQYHPGHVRRFLAQMSFSVQRPKTRLVQADPKKQNRWIRYTHPHLKKRLEPRGGDRLRRRGIFSPDPDPLSHLGALWSAAANSHSRRTEYAKGSRSGQCADG